MSKQDQYAAHNVIQRLTDERDRLRRIVEAVEALAKDPVHECGDTCEAWGCDAKGATYYVTLPNLRAALAAAGATGQHRPRSG